MEPIHSLQTTIEGHSFALYQTTKRPVPLVIEIAFYGKPAEFFRLCTRAGCPAFNLLCVGNQSWDEDLSPWPEHPCVEPDDRFTGQAPQFLKVLSEEALPWVRSQLPEAPTYTLLAGYSMGGLFSLWAGTQSAAFDAYVSASGSVWYPGFLDYALHHPFVKKPLAIYLSLGNKEIQVRNPLLQTTGQVFEELLKHYQSEGIPATFVWNQGNHFVDALGRLARGVYWTMEEIRHKEEE